MEPDIGEGCFNILLMLVLEGSHEMVLMGKSGHIKVRKETFLEMRAWKFALTVRKEIPGCV